MEDKNKLSKYIREIDPKEEKVSQILSDGYFLHSVSVLPATSAMMSYSKLIYHFILDESKNIDVGIDLANTGFISKNELEFNDNPFLDFRNEE